MVITKENDLNAVGISYHNLVGFSYFLRKVKGDMKRRIILKYSIV